MKIENYKIVNKGLILSKFDVNIEQWGLTIRDCTLFDKDGKQWVSMPSRQYKDNDGKTQYFNLIKMEEKAKERFDKAVIALIPKDEVKQELVFDEECPF